MSTFTYQDLITWSERLPDWQRDALRRVLRQGEVSGSDVSDLARLAIVARLPSEAGKPAPIPATAEDVRPSGGPLPAVNVLGLRDIEHVNALAKGPIVFGPDGLTLLYGENGSGKSGVSRVLKKACQARDPGGPIRPNVFQPTPGKPATATIDYRVGDETRDHGWVEGNDSSSELRTVNVFDARCAAVQIEKSNRVSYTPELLQVFRLLANACRGVSDKLHELKMKLGDRPANIDALGLRGDTDAGRYLANLGARSDLDMLTKLCDVTDAEQERLAGLERALADDPHRKAESEEARGRRLAALDGVTKAAWSAVSDGACDVFEAVLEEAASTARAAEVARQAFRAHSTLDGLGTAEWKALWEAARRFSEYQAYAGEPFPVVRDGAICVLCQQPLKEDAPARLASFEEFVQRDVQQRAGAAEKKRDESVTVVRDLSLPNSSRGALGDVGLVGDKVGENLRRCLVETKLRRRHLLRRAAMRPTGKRPPLSPLPDLGQIHEETRREVLRLRAASRTDDRVKMERQKAELSDRVKLATQRDVIRAEVQRLQGVEIIDTAIADCRTQVITLKAREVAKLIITDRLRSTFSQNLSAVGFSEVPVDVKLGAGEVGEHPYEMELKASRDVPPQDVLSEGEKTCIALAGFLAELETTENRSAIVLDDPVTSLDHRYRKRFAERLVKEARQRQVVVLTHDVAFLYLLRKYSSQLGVDLKEISLLRGYRGNHGVAEEGPPWVALPVKRRISRLRKELQDARALLANGDRPGYEQKASWIYDHLRKSWERAVEEVLLDGVVVRFDDAVHTQRLPTLVDISEEDIELVTAEMTRCSGYVHDESGAMFTGMPDPDTVQEDIKRLDGWVGDLRKVRGRK